MRDFQARTPQRCDIILTKEEYEIILQHRAMKRWIAKREAAQRSSLVDTPALKELIEHKSALRQLQDM